MEIEPATSTLPHPAQTHNYSLVSESTFAIKLHEQTRLHLSFSKEFDLQIKLSYIKSNIYK